MKLSKHLYTNNCKLFFKKFVATTSLKLRTTFSIIILLTCITTSPVFSQNKLIKYEVYDKNNTHFETLLKLKNDSITINTLYNFEEGSIVQIILRDSLVNDSLHIIKYEYRYPINPTNHFDRQNLKEVLEKNDYFEMVFPMRGYRLFYLHYDTIIRCEVYTKKLDIINIFKYSDYLCQVNNYFVKESGKIQFSRDSIVIKNDGKLLIDYYFRWDKVFKVAANQPNTKSEFIIHDDTSKYVDIQYHYNNEPFYYRILNIRGGEGRPRHYIMEIEYILFSKEFQYRFNNSYSTELQYDKEGQINEIKYFKNNNLYKYILITHIN
ncbi:MAG: hypothetical protein HN691_14290 [Bacteroidetes bacterium]|nr:hypothetical protein [Bacteroidota bacterium]